MVEAWKIRREALRIWHQLCDGLSEPLDRLRQGLHDARFAARVRVVPGDRPPGRKVALFLIYQPGAVQRSIARTCRYLADEGFAVLLVSNTPLADEVLRTLRPLCWRIALRPNFGYDFGGYRDGLRLIREAGLDPDRLLILNDSIWYPLHEGSRLLDRMEAAGLPFNSPVYMHNPGRRSANRHFQSFFFLLRREALTSAAFRDYWRNHRGSSTKRVVLRHGEKGFSQAMFRAGFGGTGPTTREVLQAALTSQPDAFLRRTLAYAAYADRALLDEARALLAEGPGADGWRARVLDHTGRALARHNPLGVFVYASTILLDFAFLKKRSFSDVFDGMRWQYVRAVRSGDLPAPYPEVLDEVLASKMDGTMTTDPAAGPRA